MRRDYYSLIIKLNYIEGTSNTSAEAASDVVRFSNPPPFPSLLLPPLVVASLLADFRRRVAFLIV